MKEIDFKTSHFFSIMIIFFGIVLGFIGFIILSTSIVIGLLVLVGSLMIATTHYRLRIDFKNKTFQDYVWVLGMKSGEKVKFERIEYLFIKKAKVSQTMSLRVASSTIQKEIFDGYLKFSERDKIHLITKDSKSELVKYLKPISQKLSVKIIDYSQGEPVII